MKRMHQWVVLSFCVATLVGADEKPVDLWKTSAPGETSANRGEKLAARARDNPPITRVEKITLPTMDVYPAENPNGTAVVILPGGGFRYVVPDLEGSEVASWLGPEGVSVFVVRYRTVLPNDSMPWQRPLQDSQRAIRYVRANAAKWKIDPKKVGLFGFSAGGQVAAIHLTHAESSYDASDEIDEQDAVPSFGMLVYPWRIYDAQQDGLIEPIQVTESTPPTFIVHTHDDASTSLGAVHFYSELKKKGISSELHIYQNGGHGYGSRPRPGSVIGTWKDRAVEWLKIRKLINP